MAGALKSEAEHEEVDEFEFAIGDVGQGRINLVGNTEGCPDAEDLLPSSGGLAGVGGVGDLQSSEEISFEVVSDRR